MALCHLQLNRKKEALKLLEEVATLHIKIEETCLLFIKVLKETDDDSHEEAIEKVFEAIKRAN